MALRDNNINFEVIGISEIEKLTTQAYNLIHGDTLNFGDITKIKELPECDFLHASSPCQGFSTAGKQDGIKGESGLIFEFYRLMDNYYKRGKMPTYISFENVPELKTLFTNIYNDLIKRLQNWGYNVYDTILKASDYGNPTKRERLFVVGIQKDKDHNFFNITRLEKEEANSMLPFLEEKAPEDFYCAEGIVFHSRKTKKVNKGETLGYLELGVNKYTQSNKVYDKEDICPTITTAARYWIQQGNRYRTLTPKELWKISGYSKEDWDKIENAFTKRRLTMMIGNSIALGPLSAIYKELKKEIEVEF